MAPRRLAAAAACALLSTVSLPAATYYVRTDGDDACTGLVDSLRVAQSTSCAFRTIQKGLDVASSPGDRVLVRGGTYRESLHAASSGTLQGCLTLEGTPGETVVVDAGRTMGAGDWQLSDSSLGEYRSVAADFGTRTPYAYLDGIAGYENERVGLVPYDSFRHFRVATDRYVDETTPFYVGPGTWLEQRCEDGTPGWADRAAVCDTTADCGGAACSLTGHLRIRLSKTRELRRYEAGHAPIFGTDNANPNLYKINVSQALNTLLITGSHRVFKSITFRQALRTIQIGGPVAATSNIVLDGLTVWQGDSSITGSNDAGDYPSTFVTVTRSRVYGDAPSWVFWSDAKNAPFPADNVRGTAINLKHGCSDWVIDHNHIRGGFDAVGTTDFEDRVVIKYNRIENFHDDALEIEGTQSIGRVEIFENYIANVLICFAPGQQSLGITGPLLFYRNICIQARTPAVNRDPSINNFNGSRRYGYQKSFKQEAPNTFYYHNTVFLLNSSRFRGIDVVPGLPDSLDQSDTYVFNNIFVKGSGLVTRYKLCGTGPCPGQIVDWNLYFKQNSTDSEALIDDHATVDEAYAATGFEQHGLGDVPNRGTDPRFAGFNPIYIKSDPERWLLAPNRERYAPTDFLLGAGSPAIAAARSRCTSVPCAPGEPVAPPWKHPVFGALPDSRASSADMGAIPYGADPADWSYFPFNTAAAGVVRETLGAPSRPGGVARRARLTDAVQFQPHVETSGCDAPSGLGVLRRQPVSP